MIRPLENACKKKHSQPAALLQSQFSLPQSLSHMLILPQLKHGRRTRVQSVHRIVRVLPPALDLARMRALRALLLPAERKRLFPVRRRVQRHFGFFFRPAVEFARGRGGRDGRGVAARGGRRGGGRRGERAVAWDEDLGRRPAV